MEGIPVKISEKYKPPRKITLPASVQNKFNAELKFEKYDFELERFVVGQMGKLREQQEKLSEAKVAEEKAGMGSVQLDNTNNATQNEILTPVPLKPFIQSSTSSHQALGGINISDFENDTSSPFDSVELKTLNDMEELAHVLGGTGLNREKKWPSPENGGSSWAWGRGGGYTSPPAYLPQPSPKPHTERDLPPKPVKKIDNETSVILQSLQKHMEERKARNDLANFPKKLVNSSNSSVAGVTNSEWPADKKQDLLPNPLSSLSGPSQTVARMIAEMGFPISRAARATEMFGPNEGKVIEFMLEVQSLEEAGYPGDRAERVLVLCDYSRENAVKILDSTAQLMRLGFTEENVLAALARNSFDRDKALDSLIS